MATKQVERKDFERYDLITEDPEHPGEGIKVPCIQLNGKQYFVEPTNPHYTLGFELEIPDPTPIEIPVGMGKPESIEDMIQRLMVTDQLKRLREGEMETEEEANDFDTGEPDMVISHHQVTTMIEDNIKESKILIRQNGGDVDDADDRKDGVDGDGGSEIKPPSDKPGKSDSEDGKERKAAKQEAPKAGAE